MRALGCSTPTCGSARSPTTSDFSRSPNSIALSNECLANHRPISAHTSLPTSAPAKPLNYKSRSVLRRGDVDTGRSGRCAASEIAPHRVDAPAAAAVEHHEKEKPAENQR